MTPTAIRLAMLRNGYSPIPCTGKRPAPKEWQHCRPNEQEVPLWEKLWTHAVNTGCQCRYAPVLDADISVPDACSAIRDCVIEQFEERGRVLSRHGAFPKLAIPFRTTAPFKKIKVELLSSAGRPMALEFLGDGQQFVAFGRHPDTGIDYRWLGGDLTTVPHDDLPPINEAEARTLLYDMTTLLVREFGFTRVVKPAERRSALGGSHHARGNHRTALPRVYGLIRTVALATEGDRNSKLFWAACRVRDMHEAGELDTESMHDAIEALQEAALRSALPAQEISRTIASAMGAA